MAERQRPDTEKLILVALRLRKNLLYMLKPGKVGHLGGSSSIIDVVAALYFNVMNLDPEDPKADHRDRFLLSKGHAVLAQYAALIELGYIDRTEIPYLKTLNSVLQGHPDMDKTPGIEAVTGSLGQGLSIGVGMALGFKTDNKPNRVYVVCGDGESAEGQIWEAAMAASAFTLDNITLIVDRNRLQASGITQDIFSIGQHREKLEAFGWNVIDTDGHDMNQILKAFDSAKKTKGKPTAIISHSIKGKGFSFAENVVSFHNGALTQEQFAQADKALDMQMMEAAQC